MSQRNDIDHEVIIIGAGICGVYQLYKLIEQGIDATVIESGDEVGGTWFWNRYPGARFDSESYTYGFSFSEELLQEWDWKERFSGQPENLRYVKHVVDKFDLRKHIQLGLTVQSAQFDEAATVWHLELSDGRTLTCRFMMLAIGLLSAPTLPSYEGVEDFEGASFHTYDWPTEKADLTEKRVGVVGTGATAIQLIPRAAEVAGDLTVFQRRPNWTAPLRNSGISAEEMADIKSRYDEIFDLCSRTPGGFIHRPDRRPFFEVSEHDRREMWDRLYEEPGFGIWLANFKDIFVNEEANAQFSSYMADKIRARVDDPQIAEKLIPTDHGFGVQRVPLETNYLETYNEPNVHLVDLQETPIVRVTPRGIETTAGEIELDVIVYATGFDAITGAFDRMDIRGVAGQRLRETWANGPLTSFGLQVPGFPNMLMPNGPQSAAATTNFPRGIELGVDWCTALIEYAKAQGFDRIEATDEAASDWNREVIELYEMMLMRKAQGWFTGYNSNIAGHEAGKIRYMVYNGGTPKFREVITAEAANGYPGTTFA